VGGHRKKVSTHHLLTVYLWGCLGPNIRILFHFFGFFYVYIHRVNNNKKGTITTHSMNPDPPDAQDETVARRVIPPDGGYSSSDNDEQNPSKKAKKDNSPPSSPSSRDYNLTPPGNPDFPCSYCDEPLGAFFCEGQRCHNQWPESPGRPDEELPYPLCHSCAEIYLVCRECKAVKCIRKTIDNHDHRCNVHRKEGDCARCGNMNYLMPNAVTCSFCKVARYCNNTCQEMDWVRHILSTCYPPKTAKETTTNTNQN
jgi:MYND finger